jgi:hypothetical protein
MGKPETELVVALLITLALTLLAVVGSFVVSPVMTIFAFVFGGMLLLVVAEIRKLG